MKVRSLPTPISEFLVVFSPAIVLTVLLGAVGEAIVARVVVEYFVWTARCISPFPVPDWSIEVVRFLGLLGVIAMSWRVIPPPRGVSRSIYTVAASAMYVAFWLIHPLSVAVTGIGEWLHGLATTLSTFVLGREAFASLLAGIAASTFQTFISLFTSQVIPLATTIFLALLLMTYIMLFNFMTGIVLGLVSKAAVFLRAYLQHHPAWYLLLMMIIADSCACMIMAISTVILSLILGASVALIVSVVISKAPWSFLSEIASGFVAIIVSIFLSNLMNIVLNNTSRYIEDMFNIRPPLGLTIFGILLATAGAIALTILMPMIYTVTGLYIIGSALTLLGILAGGVPKRPKQLRNFVTTLITLFMLAAIAGPLLGPIRHVFAWAINMLKTFGIIK